MSENTETRTRSFSKGDLVNALSADLKARGIKMSKTNVWDLYKLMIERTFQLASESEKGLSLAGVGKIFVLKAKAPADSGKPYIPRFRFRPSQRLQRALTEAFDKGTKLELVASPEGTAEATAPAEAQGEV